MPFADYLQALREQDRGINLPSPEYVPSTFRFAFVADRIAGRVAIRHRLNAVLERGGGHIGSVVVPGGVLQHTIALADARTPLRRYWIAAPR